MSKCIFCSKENDGLICKHCLAKGANEAGSAIKKSADFAIKAAPVVLSVATFIATKGKKKPKI